MIYVKGDLLKCFKSKTKNGNEVTILQVLANGGKAVRLIEVTDYDNQKWEKGEQNISVKLKPYSTKQGRLGINYIAQGAN